MKNGIENIIDKYNKKPVRIDNPKITKDCVKFDVTTNKPLIERTTVQISEDKVDVNVKGNIPVPKKSRNK
ncbi:MAG: hypothetical protein LBH98_08245 [Chitinispirillales bacterium]|jgi:hypothetical protein|nr:hypothetical protein [Chitinispirillales bacterium]